MKKILKIIWWNLKETIGSLIIVTLIFVIWYLIHYIIFHSDPYFYSIGKFFILIFYITGCAGTLSMSLPFDIAWWENPFDNEFDDIEHEI